MQELKVMNIEGIECYEKNGTAYSVFRGGIDRLFFNAQNFCELFVKNVETKLWSVVVYLC